jgi:hypothetical protein
MIPESWYGDNQKFGKTGVEILVNWHNDLCIEMEKLTNHIISYYGCVMVNFRSIVRIKKDITSKKLMAVKKIRVYFCHLSGSFASR